MITHPRVAELLEAVIAYLGMEGGPRPGYMALVARNALAIVSRELALAPEADARAAARLGHLLGDEGDLGKLEMQLCDGLRDGRIAAESPALLSHLRAQVLDRLAIDQPNYRHQMRL